ncbi:N-acetylmuramoyl-L-alanine amidase [Streptomyces angustmyceticus]|uniref:N-acetylmuramoyl-L-alanine amidase n=1 Tax=Streptomyces angustmyceticus TaxID=285578 RepID=A0A5J4LLB3_9ACTN|nr:N-acetylmuramoyl-L-alanine amidase [Streptomyces angustmyceticus]UAL69452.1 N-acetylmuramoyl-L-alanine amidase [Streptomyces angustmyceticus]GES32791.1 N-acetylmuramoyl-L-alanine amidase [Streptomyces angustmyceticus]
MSNGSTPPAPRRRLRGTLLVVVAAVAVVGLGGWLVWRSPGAGGEPPRAGGISGHGTGHRPAGEDGGHGSRGSGPGKGQGSLRGKVVVIDPGHNPHNRDHGREIARQVDIGNSRKECDTTGTSTDDGYAEASFTLDVARRARTLLQKAGAKVVFTQDGDRSYGPCVDKRAAIGNRAHADAALSLHADGSAAGNRGFHVILPARVTAGPADTAAIVKPSRRLGERLADRFHAITGSARSNYIGDGTGLDVRSDLGGLNLSTVPKVFLECGNMRDPKDAAQLTDARWRQKAARGITEGITDFLEH